MKKGSVLFKKRLNCCFFCRFYGSLVPEKSTHLLPLQLSFSLPTATFPSLSSFNFLPYLSIFSSLYSGEYSDWLRII